VRLIAAPAGGATSQARVDLRPGGLSASGPSAVELPPVRLSGRAVTVEAEAGPFRVVDTRGDAPGWSLVVQAARPVDALGRRLGASLVVRPGATPPPGGVMLGRTATVDTPVAVMHAPPGTGTGAFVVTPRLRLTVPADTPTARYVTTLVVTVS
jgi:hypothetical protein